MHFAHGASVVIASYAVYTFFTLWKVPFVISTILTIAVAALAGYVMFKLVYQPLQKKKSSTVILLIASIGMLILFENLILLLFGADVKAIGLIEVAKGVEIGSAIITPLQMVLVATSAILFVALYVFMNKTKLGRNLRAVSDNKELAAIVGLNTARLMTIAIIIGSILAGVAGILIGLEQNMEPTMGTNLMVKGFSGAVIGGIFSVPGSILGSYIVGAAENFGIWWLPSGYKDAITFILLFLFLIFRPTGIWGVDKGVKG